jgi:hypothetical protein
LVLDAVDRLFELCSVAAGGDQHLSLRDCRAAVDALIDKVHGDAGNLDPRLKRLTDRIKPGEGGKKRRVDV